VKRDANSEADGLRDVCDEDRLLRVIKEKVHRAGRCIEVNFQHHRRAFAEFIVSCYTLHSVQESSTATQGIDADARNKEEVQARSRKQNQPLDDRERKGGNSKKTESRPLSEPICRWLSIVVPPWMMPTTERNAVRVTKAGIKECQTDEVASVEVVNLDTAGENRMREGRKKSGRQLPLALCDWDERAGRDGDRHDQWYGRR
jgi:hypothetical protein